MLKPLLLSSVILAASVLPAAAQEEIGEIEFLVSCAVCHGNDAKGGGQLAPLLRVEVPDLTRLARANEGEFPFVDVLMTIDGRAALRGHGSPMPVWGTRYKAAAQDLAGTLSAELLARGRMLSLVHYLDSIQQ